MPKSTPSCERALDADSTDEIILNGARGSFLPLEGKAALVAAFQAELDMLKQTAVPGG